MSRWAFTERQGRVIPAGNIDRGPCKVPPATKVLAAVLSGIHAKREGTIKAAGHSGLAFA